MTEPCPHCGLAHATKCPLVKSYEYHPDGTLKRVEFFAPNDFRPVNALPWQPSSSSTLWGVTADLW